MYELALVLIFFIIIIFVLCSNKENYAYAPFSAHLFPKINRDKWNSYQQLSRLPYSNPPVGPYTLGWDKLQNLKQEYPTQIKLYKLLHPA
jgi:hypothetical protein